MRAFITARARQEPRQQDRRDQPCERHDLERGGRAAHRQIDRKCRERRQASEQPRRHERAMARTRQRVISRGRMQQRIETIADDIQNRHRLGASACSSNRRGRIAPFIVASTCQSGIKRTLRRAGSRPKARIDGVFAGVKPIYSMQMVNDRFPERKRYGFELVDIHHRPISARNPVSIENLQRIK